MRKIILVLLLSVPGCIPVGNGWGYDMSARNQLIKNEREHTISELQQEIDAANQNAYSLSSYYPEGF